MRAAGLPQSQQTDQAASPDPRQSPNVCAQYVYRCLYKCLYMCVQVCVQYVYRKAKEKKPRKGQHPQGFFLRKDVENKAHGWRVLLGTGSGGGSDQ